MKFRYERKPKKKERFKDLTNEEIEENQKIADRVRRVRKAMWLVRLKHRN